MDNSAGICQPPGIPPPSSSIGLYAPPDGIVDLPPIAVFRWSRSNKPTVQSYLLEISSNANFQGQSEFYQTTATQLPVRLDDKLFGGTPYFWRVFGLSFGGISVDESQQVFSFEYEGDNRGFTVIRGLVRSDLNQAGLVGARVAVSSLKHYLNGSSSIAFTVDDEQYFVIAVTIDNNGDRIPLPIKISYTKEGFKPTSKDVFFREDDIEIEDVVMESTADSDGDGILDKVETDSQCLDANDADSDDDGIGDGNEDINKNGSWDRDLGETNPCNADSDGDGLSDKVETDAQCLDPNDVDTDGDGIEDGDEDINMDGSLDQGETDPCVAESSNMGAGALPAILKHLLLKD
jgi:hypothetical protein